MLVLFLLGCSWIARTTGCGAPSASPGNVPIFSSPFAGDHVIPNYFDHGSGQDGRQLLRTGHITGGTRGHTAYDFGMAEGTELSAMAAGVVLKARDLGPKACNGRGRAAQNIQVWVMTDPAPDGNRYIYEFRHLSQVLVAKGDRVVAGQLVARSGNTGCSSGPHLHLEVLHVTDPETGEGWQVDPYGWAGSGRDPRAVAGHPSPDLWIPGQAPAIRRTAKHPPGNMVFGPQQMVGTDGLDPIGGEWVDLGLDAAAPGPRSLAGMKLRNERGESFALPPRTLAPGQQLRVWTRNAAPGPDGVSWGRNAEAWDDLADCAELVDRDGAVIGALRYGRGHAKCPGWNGPPQPEEPDQPDE